MNKILIDTKAYTVWHLVTYPAGNPVTDPAILAACDPAKNRLLNGDVITADGTLVPEYTSPLRTTQCIPAVLILKDNRTYGRANGRTGRLLYRATPNDPALPDFLVAYEDKSNEFCKVKKNKYVVIQFKNWVVTSRHPHAELVETIGAVDVLSAYYKYEMECKGLNIPMPKELKNVPYWDDPMLIHNLIDKAALCGDYEGVSSAPPSSFIFSIDGADTRDFDDAFSIEYDAEKKITTLTIYISNVSAILDQMGSLNLLSKRVATIYLPENKIPMLPRLLSEDGCSLVEGEYRLAFAMTIIIPDDTESTPADPESTTVKQEGGASDGRWSITFSNKICCIARNFVYDSEELLSNEHYQRLARLTQKVFDVGSTAPLFNFMYAPKDSAEVVAYWMLFMNWKCATVLHEKGRGIFRRDGGSGLGQPNVTSLVAADIQRAITGWQAATAGEYCLAATADVDCRHTTLDVDHYVHITSPIRRLVDLVNMIELQIANGMVKGAVAERMRAFVEGWTSAEGVAYINAQMRGIRKVQARCSLLHTCSLIAMTEGNKVYEGVVFGRQLAPRAPRTFSGATYKWNVYICELKMFSEIITDRELANYDTVECRLYVMNDENTFRRKVRVMLVSSAAPAA